MTVALLELLVGLLLGYCAIICVQLIPALTGKSKPGTHCTGSLFALGFGVISAWLTDLLGAGLLAGLGGALGSRLGRGSTSSTPGESPTPGTTPSPSEPSPSIPASPEIPALPAEIAYITNTYSAGAAVSPKATGATA